MKTSLKHQLAQLMRLILVLTFFVTAAHSAKKEELKNMTRRQSSDGQTWVGIELDKPLPGVAREFVRLKPPEGSVQIFDDCGGRLEVTGAAGDLVNVVAVQTTLAKPARLHLKVHA